MGGREGKGELTSLVSIEVKVIAGEGGSEEGEVDAGDANPEEAGGQGEFVMEGDRVSVHREEEGESGEGEQEKMAQKREVVED